MKNLKKFSNLNKLSEFLNTQNLQSENFQILCVTGKMASGKNYVCSLLEASGYKAVDLDLLVHKAIDFSSQKILETFSPLAEQKQIKITNPDGTINRKNLGKLLFSDKALLAKQEEIVYPKVIELTESFIKQNPKAIINATVLYKTPQLLNLCQAVVFVTAPFFTRLFRAKKRDHLPLKQIISRFNSQKNLLKFYKSSEKPVFLVKNS